MQRLEIAAEDVRPGDTLNGDIVAAAPWTSDGYVFIDLRTLGDRPGPRGRHERDAIYTACRTVGEMVQITR